MELLFATKNKAKLAEASQVLSRCGIEVVSFDIDLSEPDAGTVEQVAQMKLQQVMVLGKNRVMVDDAGIFFAAYPEFPGVLTRRIFNLIGYRGISKLLTGESRQAWFKGTVAICWDGQIRTFSGITRGRIADAFSEEIEADPRFPFDSIFIPEGDTRALQEMPVEERLAYSYRRRALEKMAEWLKIVGK
ncbi:non-canonical purine NTP pyrophosphatase [Paenactinomyces guangxiensis]|uniref:Non-canonical purine NTP pyrophosphatase n=1 Tax=Paenactinomyces guangxiensis TaxID=1490290 RepID=A0A7W2A9Y4_9BACL|nr:non-canonical purine NTP pyrophosphatase [Paenactinomyces guangxiensis]MBA4496220.1 non-canonical purine NTP pyrophosphatase [Paenactinomyces guangxiensis]MBH8593309.1 hypothetical protein [Paenactinomyces guangxiensis]